MDNWIHYYFFGSLTLDPPSLLPPLPPLRSESPMKAPFVLLPLFALCGCASLSSYQDARVLNQGEGRLGVAVTPYKDDLKPVIFQGSDTGHSYTLFELTGRMGVWDNLDVGVKYTFLGAASADAKYQILGRDSNSIFQLSAGLKGGYASLESQSDSGKTTSDVPVIDLIVPVYVGWTPKSWVGLTLAPEFCYRISDNDFYPSGPIAGANVDLRLGKKAGVVVEYGYHRHLTKDYTLQNYGISAYAPFEFHSLLSMIGM